MREKNAFYVTHISLISRLEPMEYVYPELSDVTAYSQPKQAVMSASDYIETTYHDVRIFMQLTQCCVFIRHLEGVRALINNFNVLVILYFMYSLYDHLFTFHLIINKIRM